MYITTNQRNKKNLTAILAFALVLIMCFSQIAYSTPTGPTITFIANETKPTAGATKINTSGGTITTVTLNTTSQNLRWKAYVGNVSGTLTLDDANDNTIFDWTLTDVIGEIYATRSTDSINWTGINCSDTTHIENENRALNHTNIDDNITSTFDETTHSGFYVGTSVILENTCRAVHTYVNSSSQESNFEEIVLYDGTTEENGNIVYATPFEQNAYGFDNSTYDFQMILPDNGLSTWSSSVAYYFYVELT